MTRQRIKKFTVYRTYIKRPLDVILSLLGLLVLSPVMLITALLVRVKLGSPVLFRQRRPGKDEKIFVMYKFRSMSEKRDREGNLLPDQERMTGFGKGLRAASLDELPELFNILKGDMSVVGPRPLLIEYLPLYTEEQRHRHDVRPGLTGLAQTRGRNELSWEEKFCLDLDYVRDMTFFLDMKIMLETVKVVVKRKGIHSIGCETANAFRGKCGEQGEDKRETE